MIFMGYVSFREGTWPIKHGGWKTTYLHFGAFRPIFRGENVSFWEGIIPVFSQ